MTKKIDVFIPEKGADVLGIKYMDLDLIKKLGKNFKKHDVESIARSISSRGLLTPIGIDELTDENFDGNGRVESLVFLRDNGSPAPRKVVEKDGKWFVPVLTGIAFETEAERVSAAAALNRLNELGGYDEAIQAEVLDYLLKEDALDATGFDKDDVQALLKKYADKDGEKQPEKIAPPLPSAGIQPRTTAPVSATRQTQLLFSPDEHTEFLNLSVKLSKIYGTKDVTSTVLEAMRRAAALTEQVEK